MSLIKAPGARARVRCVFSPCLVRRNGAHQKIERRAEHLSWMAVAHWIDATTNQTTLTAVGWMLERRLKRAERVGVDVYSSLWVANGATKKIKIERAMGPRISMAFSGWEDTTTNIKAALTLDYNMERQRAGR